MAGPDVATTSGYDAPAVEDALGRWSFAQRIAEIIEHTPPTQSVRIGVYGQWGAGKTSVLNFIEELAGGAGHLVVRFSPWGLTSPAEMWTKLAEAVMGRVEAARRDDEAKPTGLQRLRRFRLKHAARFQGVHAEWQKIKDGWAVTKGIAAVVNPLLGPDLAGLLRVTGKDLAEAAGNTRVVVLVDDLDRTDPKLVPHLLFALRELFDTPRFTWILSIDPRIVGKALSAYHEGFGSGDFLEKIVEFPFWLPACSREQLWALAEVDLRRFGSPVPVNAIKDAFELFPTNPRQLRSALRHFLSLRGLLARLDPDEIDYGLLVLVVLLHCADAQGMRTAVDDTDTLRKVTSVRLHLHRDDSERSQKEADVAADKLVGLFAGEDRDRIKALLLRLGTGGWWADETIVEYVALLQSPPEVTLKEARAAFAAFSASAASFEQWCRDFSGRMRLPLATIGRALFRKALALHHSEVDRAASSFGEDVMRAHIESARRMIGFLSAIVDKTPGVHASDVLVPSIVEEGFSKMMEWAHFVAPPDYLPLRHDEAGLLQKLFKTLGDVDPISALELLAPWDDWRYEQSDTRDRARLDAKKPLFDEVLPLAAKHALTLLTEVNGVASAIGNKDRRSHRYLIFRRTSPMWTTLRGDVNATLSLATEVVADNATDLLVALVGRRGDGFRGGEIGASEVQEFLRDEEAMRWLWEASTRVVPNMRRFKSLNDLRQSLAEALGKDLGAPAWWAWKEQQWKDASAPHKDGPASEEAPETSDSDKV